MKGFQAGIQTINESETQLFGISVDAAPSLKRFSDDLGLAFPLLSDFPNRATAKAYGVLMEERGIASRTTFVIDPAGQIATVFTKVKPAGHAADVMAAIG